MKPYFTTNKGMLFQADCLEVLNEIKDNSIDCVFADPPFNLGKNYKNGYKDNLSDPIIFLGAING